MGTAMKWLVLAASIFFAGCQFRTQAGDCVGVWDKQRPNVEYAVSKRNILVGLVLVETIIVPAHVVLCELWCPVDYETAQ